jgi:hypothetical protein
MLYLVVYLLLVLDQSLLDRDIRICVTIFVLGFKLVDETFSFVLLHIVVQVLLTLRYLTIVELLLRSVIVYIAWLHRSVRFYLTLLSNFSLCIHWIGLPLRTNSLMMDALDWRIENLGSSLCLVFVLYYCILHQLKVLHLFHSLIVVVVSRHLRRAWLNVLGTHWYLL